MKKLLSAFLTVAVCGATLFGAVACGGNKPSDSGDDQPVKYKVYAPDGAPALSLLNAMSKQGGDYDFRFHVIDSATIQAQVTGENPAADFCVLPVNLASKLLGTGETYKMLGTVTNGNLYFLTTGENPVLTPENLKNALVGKKVGTVQLTNVPGLTLQAVLNDYEIGYRIIESVQANADPDKVNLINLGTDATAITPAYGCDYYLCPEPAATTKINATSATANPLKAAGDLQELYGGEDGYPQAVLVAKSSIIESDKAAVELMISYMKDSAEYLKTVSIETIIERLEGARTEGLTPSFNANNLNATVIANCSVWFTAAQDCKTAVNAFLAKLIDIDSSLASTVSDQFYFEG